MCFAHLRSLWTNSANSWFPLSRLSQPLCYTGYKYCITIVVHINSRGYTMKYTWRTVDPILWYSYRGERRYILHHRKQWQSHRKGQRQGVQSRHGRRRPRPEKRSALARMMDDRPRPSTNKNMTLMLKRVLWLNDSDAGQDLQAWT
jgi:hypothetical protein